MAKKLQKCPKSCLSKKSNKKCPKSCLSKKSIKKPNKKRRESKARRTRSRRKRSTNKKCPTAKARGTRSKRKRSMKAAQSKRKLSLYKQDPKILNEAFVGAVANLDLDNAKKLLESGAKVDYKSEYGETPLSALMTMYYDGEDRWRPKKLDMIKFLVKSGANINHTVDCDYDNRPLNYSVGEGNDIALVKFLLKNKADINAKNSFGNTALHDAIDSFDAQSNPNLDIIRLLLNSGYRTNIRNNKGLTAYDLIIVNSPGDANVELLDIFDRHKSQKRREKRSIVDASYLAKTVSGRHATRGPLGMLMGSFVGGKRKGKRYTRKKNKRKIGRARGPSFTPAQKDERSGIASKNRRRSRKFAPSEALEDENHDWWYEHQCPPRNPAPPCKKTHYKKQVEWKNGDKKICCYSKKSRDYASLAAAVTRGRRVPGKDYTRLERRRDRASKVHDPNYRRQIHEFMEQNPEFINSKEHDKFIAEVEDIREDEQWWADARSTYYLHGTWRDNQENADQAKIVKDVLMSYGKGDRRMNKLLADKIAKKQDVPKELSVVMEEYLPPSSGGMGALVDEQTVSPHGLTVKLIEEIGEGSSNENYFNIYNLVRQGADIYDVNFKARVDELKRKGRLSDELISVLELIWDPPPNTTPLKLLENLPGVSRGNVLQSRNS
tara:strand:- start:8012 stop:10000 length:1989 start_codon:yes stop_codon:yes gene_type:complete